MEDLGGSVMIILKWTLKNWDVEVLYWFCIPRDRIPRRALVNTVTNSRVSQRLSTWDDSSFYNEDFVP